MKPNFYISSLLSLLNCHCYVRTWFDFGTQVIKQR